MRRRPDSDPVPLPATWWGRAGPIPPRRSIVELQGSGVLDGELAALLWLLVEARLPVVVTGMAGTGRTTLMTALLDFLPADARPVPLAGADEEFEWMPEATELGWRRERPASQAGATPLRGRAGSGSAVMLVSELGDRPPEGTWGPRARIVIRALALGYGMAATVAGERLADVLGSLKAAPVSADDDELSRLGIVLAVKAFPGADPRAGVRRRVIAAHYVRPVVRDAHGHVQRMSPAVLAAYEPRTDRLEHFAWGIVGELAGRTGRSPIEFEREQARRAAWLRGLLTAGVLEPGAVRAAIARYLEAPGDPPA